MTDAKSYVEKIRKEIEDSRGSRLWKDSINMLSTVSESIFSRSAHFILELLQNAEDAGSKIGAGRGEIEFRISPNELWVSHNGAPFSEANVNAICGVRSTKKPDEGTLGYLGIGFKSVFKITDCPQIHSGDFHFKFDRAAHADPADVPWQIMPLWVDPIPDDLDSALTTFILPFRTHGLYLQTLEELKKLDVHLFLFLKWLRTLRIVDGAAGQTTVIENLGEQNGIVSLRKDGSPHRFVIRRRISPVPPEVAKDPVLEFYKRRNVKQREVVIAFAVDEADNLQPIQDASALGSVSSFLPLGEERSGAKFLLQADFLVQPGREAIQYELAWNHWLVNKAVDAAKEAIEMFKKHPIWRRQFLPIFNFASHDGQAAFDRLFKPELRDPIMAFLKGAEIFPTASGLHVRPELAVQPDEQLKALLTDADLPLIFWGRTDLALSDPSLDFEALPSEIASIVTRVDLAKVARNHPLLEKKAKQPDNVQWFVRLYRAMAETNQNCRQEQGRKRGKIIWFPSPIYVLTENNAIVSANNVYLRQVKPEVLDLRRQFVEVDRVLDSYHFLHSSLETPELTQFFKDRTDVQSIDYDRICRDIFLPKVKAEAPAPPKEELIAYTRLLQKGPPVYDEIWVLTKRGNIKSSKQVFLGTEYSPSENWEKHGQYSPQIDFLSSDYLHSVTEADHPAWKEFFLKVGVKDKGEIPHVEIFATNYVQDKLRSELRDFIPKGRQQHGYDLEATHQQDNSLVKIEVKGRKQEGPVELVGNEPKTAKQAKDNRELFWVCIVPNIPESPELWVVDDPLEAGDFDTLKIDVSKWKTFGRRIA